RPRADRCLRTPGRRLVFHPLGHRWRQGTQETVRGTRPFLPFLGRWAPHGHVFVGIRDRPLRPGDVRAEETPDRRLVARYRRVPPRWSQARALRSVAPDAPPARRRAGGRGVVALVRGGDLEFRDGLAR